MLTHTNFAVWSNSIKYVLIGTNTWDIVTGVEDVPQGGDVEYREYYKRSNKAVSILYGSITPAIQAYSLVAKKLIPYQAKTHTKTHTRV